MNLLDDIDNELWNTKCCIYCYTNILNNKKYIGQVNRKKYNLKQRHKQHIHSSKNKNAKDYNVPIHKAIRKYGIKNFKLEILSFCDIYSVDMLEKFFIILYDTITNGYNISDGGSNGNNFAGKTEEEMSEIKNKISNKAKERFINKENHPMYNKHHSKKTKEKISNSNKGRRKSEKEIIEISKRTKGNNNPMYGKKHSDETKNKISIKNKGKKRTQEQKYNMSKNRIGKPKGKLVAQIDENTQNILNIMYAFEYKNIGFDTSHISSCCKQKLKKHKGFVFKYIYDCTNEQISLYIIKNKQVQILRED